MGSKAGTGVNVGYGVNVSPANGQWEIGMATIVEFLDGEQTDTRAIEFVNCGGGGSGGEPGIESDDIAFDNGSAVDAEMGVDQSADDGFRSCKGGPD